jgi:PKD repeat protein
MKKILLLVAFIIPFVLGQSQGISGERLVQKVNMALGINGEGVKHKEMHFEVPFSNRNSFATVAFKFYGVPQGSIQMEIAYADEKGSFTDWKLLSFDDHTPSEAEYIVTILEEIDPQYNRFKVRLNTPVIKKFKSEVHWYLPPSDFNLSEKILPQARLEDNCILPAYVTRTGWSCPSGQAFTGGTPSFTNVTHLVVHHSAGSNTPGNNAARVLAIWDYHVNTNNYSDIAYNFLIDPNGVIYEGRGGNEGYTKDVLSAATCGNNGGSMAVCLLGNFETAEPTAAALESLEKLLAWKASEKGIDAAASSFLTSYYGTINNVFGHRQGCSTACPGQNLFDELPAIRLNVASEVTAGCTEGTPSITTGTLSIDDNNDGDSQGNSDGVVNDGETIEMYLTVANNGDVLLNNLVATISTDNPCVSYIDNSIDFGNIGIGQTLTNGDFDVVFSPNCEEGPIVFTITYTFDGGVLTSSVTIPVFDSEDPCSLPAVSFTINPISGASPLTVQTNNTTSDAVSYLWQITGPTNYESTEVNPVFVLPNPGDYLISLTTYNECGPNTFIPPYYIEVHTITDIGDNEMITSFYPNPTKKKLNIVFKQAISNGEINIINSGGQSVYTGNFSGSNTEVNVRDFAAGIYILQVRNTDQPEAFFNFTFVKKN